MISDMEFVRLASRLTLPAALSDLVRRGKPLDGPDELALRALLAEMSPLQVLAGIACSVGILAGIPGFDRGSAASLKLQADFILDDYGPALLHSDPSLEREWSVHIQEDLECLTHTLEVALALAIPGSTFLTGLCTILLEQAQDHIAALDDTDLEVFYPLDQAPASDEEPEAQAIGLGGNVVLFPKSRTSLC